MEAYLDRVTPRRYTHSLTPVMSDITDKWDRKKCAVKERTQSKDSKTSSPTTGASTPNVPIRFSWCAAMQTVSVYLPKIWAMHQRLLQSQVGVNLGFFCIRGGHTPGHGLVFRQMIRPRPVCIQNQQIHRECHIYCPPLSPYTGE